MSKLTISRRGLRGVVVVAVAASFLGSLPAHGVQAAGRPAAELARVAAAGDPVDGTRTDWGHRFKAAAVVVWVPREELSMADRDFVIVLWEKADEFFHPEVKKAAAAAFTDRVDPDASMSFIMSGIFAANDRDAALKEVRAQRDAERLSAAQELGWVPADDNARRVLLRSTNSNFLLELGRKSEPGSEVRQGAEAVVEAAEEVQLAFIATGVHTAAATDRANKIAAGRQKELEEQQRKTLREIKAAAIAAALGRVATQFELDYSAERDLIYKIKTEAPGVEVRTAAAVAYDSDNSEDWRAFLATGVHVARNADNAERDRAEAAENERKVREILDNAKADRYQPAMVAAASAALQGNAAARTKFLLKGRDEAAAKDIISPANNLVIELKGLQSGRCIQVGGLWGHGAENNGAGTELWDCVAGNKQRWVLLDRGEGRFSLKNVNSHKCLANNGTDDGQGLAQYDCANIDAQWFRFVPVGNGATVQVRNVRSGKVATAVDNGTGNGTGIAQYTGAEAANQRWRILDLNRTSDSVAVQPGVIQIQGVQSQRCIQVGGLWDVPNQGAHADYAGMELWDCVASYKMRWEVIDLGDHKYALKNGLSGKCLDVHHSSAGDGVALIQFGCHLGPNQQWVFIADANGSLRMQSALTGSVATVRSAETHNAALVQQFGDGGGNHQRWKIVRL